MTIHARQTKTMLSTPTDTNAELNALRQDLARIAPGDAAMLTDCTIEKAIKLIASAINGTNPHGASNRALAQKACTILASHSSARAQHATTLAQNYLALTRETNENDRTA